MKYIEVLGVPVYRGTNALASPVTAIAARLSADGGTVELRVGSEKGRVYCLIGVETSVMLKQAVRLLEVNGYLCKVHERVFGSPMLSTVLVRRLESYSRVVLGAAAVQSFMLPPLTIDNNRFEAVYAFLNNMRTDCGIVFFFRKSRGIDTATFTRISQLERTSGDVLKDVLESGERFEAIGGVFGSSGEEPETLLSEVTYAFPGLSGKAVAPVAATKELFEKYKSGYVENIKKLEMLYTSGEVDALSDITASGGVYGLPINKDTIFGIPENDPLFEISEEAKKESVIIGYSESGKPYYISLKMLRKHVFIAGEPGSGKGNELFSVAYQLYKHGVPILLLESAKKEQHHLGKVIPELKVWRPSEGEFIYDPFQLPDGVKLKDYRASLLQTLRVCFKLDGPLEELFGEALNRCFARYGYTDESMLSDVGTVRFGLNEFIEEYTALLEEEDYSVKTKQDMRTAGLVRLNSLFNENRGVFDTVSSVPVKELIKGENLIQLNCLPTVESKQLFATMLLISLSAYLRLCCNTLSDKPLRLVIMLDESHNLLSSVNNAEGEEYSFARDFYNLLLELRSLGVGVIMADQSTDNLPKQLSAVCATKMFFGCSPFSGVYQNREYLKADDVAIDNLYRLVPGEGCFQTYGMKRGAYIKTQNLIDKFGLEEEYEIENKYIKNNKRMFTETFRECKICPSKGKCGLDCKIKARQLSTSLLLQFKADILGAYQNKDDLNKLLALFAIKVYDRADTECCRYCTVVQFVRDLNRVQSKKLDVGYVLSIAKHVWANKENIKSK